MITLDNNINWYNIQNIYVKPKEGYTSKSINNLTYLFDKKGKCIIDGFKVNCIYATNQILISDGICIVDNTVININTPIEFYLDTQIIQILGQEIYDGLTGTGIYTEQKYKNKIYITVEYSHTLALNSTSLNPYYAYLNIRLGPCKDPLFDYESVGPNSNNTEFLNNVMYDTNNQTQLLLYILEVSGDDEYTSPQEENSNNMNDVEGFAINHRHNNNTLDSIDWSKVLNKPDPIYELTGDVVGDVQVIDMENDSSTDNDPLVNNVKVQRIILNTTLVDRSFISKDNTKIEILNEATGNEYISIVEDGNILITIKNGCMGINNINPTEKIEINNGNIKLNNGQFKTTITNQSPFNVMSTILNENLNSDLLDGLHKGYNNNTIPYINENGIVRIKQSLDFFSEDNTTEIFNARIFSSDGKLEITNSDLSVRTVIIDNNDTDSGDLIFNSTSGIDYLLDNYYGQFRFRIQNNDIMTTPFVLNSNGYVGINFNNPDTHIVVGGNIKYTDQLISTTTTKAPFVVTSSLMVNNLNANYLNGKIATDFSLTTHTHAGTYIPYTEFTDLAILNKIKNVDGTNSGLDADLLDGNHASSFVKNADIWVDGVVPILKGGTGSTQATGGGFVVLQTSPTFLGVPSVPTPEIGTNTDQIASTKFVKNEIENELNTSNSVGIPLGGILYYINENPPSEDFKLTDGTQLLKTEFDELYELIGGNFASADFKFINSEPWKYQPTNDQPNNITLEESFENGRKIFSDTNVMIANYKVVITNKRVYLIGGAKYKTENSIIKPDGYSSDIYYSDLDDDGKLVPGNFVKDTYKLPRGFIPYSCILLNTRIYIFGGIEYNTILYADLDNNGLLESDFKEYEAVKMPDATITYSKAVLISVTSSEDSKTAGQIYLVTDQGTYGTWVYSSGELKDKFTKIATGLPTAKYPKLSSEGKITKGFEIFNYDNSSGDNIYLYGGFFEDYTASPYIFRYDQTNGWEKIPYILPYGMAFLDILTNANNLYILSAYCFDYNNNLVYNNYNKLIHIDIFATNGDTVTLPNGDPYTVLGNEVVAYNSASDYPTQDNALNAYGTSFITKAGIYNFVNILDPEIGTYKSVFKMYLSEKYTYDDGLNYIPLTFEGTPPGGDEEDYFNLPTIDKVKIPSGGYLYPMIKVK